MILTANEIRKLYRFCHENKWCNVKVFTDDAGVGTIVKIAKQNDYIGSIIENTECKKVDITDYESW